jgi:ABC-type nitrate/sulfonate/bicarbonate transport system permease component
VTTSGAVARRLLRAANLPGLLFFVGLSGIWELLVDTKLVTYQFLPAPWAVLKAAEQLTAAGEFGRNIAHTVMATLLGWLIAAAVGIVLGVVLASSRVLWSLTAASVEVLRSLPAIAFVPLAILIFGFSLNMELVVIVYVSQWPILINTIDGVRSVTPMHRDVSRVMRLSRLECVRKILLPAAAPHIVVGLQLGLGLALALAIVAEMLGNPTGIGYALGAQLTALQPAKMFAYVIVTGVLGVALNASFLLLVRLTFPGTKALLEGRV